MCFHLLVHVSFTSSVCVRVPFQKHIHVLMLSSHACEFVCACACEYTGAACVYSALSDCLVPTVLKELLVKEQVESFVRRGATVQLAPASRYV